MLLSDRTIASLLDSGDIKIVPAPTNEQIQPISLDLKLGNSFALQTPEPGQWHRFIGAHTVVRPGEFLLACTEERITLPAHIAGFVHGKSTWARKGLMVEAAGLVDPGFDGTITLELKNLSHHPLPLVAGRAICQLSLHAVDTAVVRPYGSAGLGSRYQNQVRAEPPRA